MFLGWHLGGFGNRLTQCEKDGDSDIFHKDSDKTMTFSFASKWILIENSHTRRFAVKFQDWIGKAYLYRMREQSSVVWRREGIRPAVAT